MRATAAAAHAASAPAQVLDTITADGKVTRIGGVAGKIRGATNKGCNLVGVPHENIKGVSDIVVLDGIKKLMAIQVFSFKTLEEALMVASKDKPEEVQSEVDLWMIDKIIQSSTVSILPEHFPEKHFALSSYLHLLLKISLHLKKLHSKVTGKNKKRCKKVQQWLDHCCVKAV